MTTLKRITAYTDGACKGNPGPGGIGILLIFNGTNKELSLGFNDTTNNQMELLAAAYALSELNQSCFVTLYSDSAYVVNGMNNKWIDNWKKNGWKNSAKKDVKNKDLWLLLDRMAKRHGVTFKHVKAHSGHPQNELADKLAVQGSQQPKKLNVDKFVKELHLK